MFVTPDDFQIIPYAIPNLDRKPTFQEFADREEREILIKLFGRSFYEKFAAGLAEDPVPERWVNLRDGVAYEYQSKTYHYDGIKKFLVPYIFSQWTSATDVTNTGIGVVKGKSENSDRVSSAPLIVKSWMDFYQQVYGFPTCYPVSFNSLYGYLYYSDQIYVADISPSYTDIKTYLYNVVEDVGTKNIYDL